MEGLQEFVGQMTCEPCLLAFCLCHLPVSSSHNAFAYFGGYFSILNCYYVPSFILPRTLSLIFLISSELFKNLKWHSASDFTVFFGEWRRGKVQSKTVAHAKYVLPGSTHPPWLLDEFAACAGPHPGVPHCWLSQAYMHRSNSPEWHRGDTGSTWPWTYFLVLTGQQSCLIRVLILSIRRWPSQQLILKWFTNRFPLFKEFELSGRGKSR